MIELKRIKITRPEIDAIGYRNNKLHYIKYWHSHIKANDFNWKKYHI